MEKSRSDAPTIDELLPIDPSITPEKLEIELPETDAEWDARQARRRFHWLALEVAAAAEGLFDDEYLVHLED